MEVYGVVYVITCLLNSMKYVGQTTRSVERRFKEHFYEKIYIGSAMRKYGMENFKIEVIETCETREQLNEREIFWIRELNCKSPNGYNRTDGGEGIAGLKFTPEHCANISAALSGENHPLFGKHLSDEQSFNLSANQRGESPYKNLLCEIDKHKLSYAKLAERLGLANVSEKIRGEKNFTVAQVAKLVEFFGLPAEYLLARDDEDEHEKILAAKYDDSPYKILVMSMIKKRLTYSMLAERLGLSHQAVSYKMLGKVKFSERDIAKLVEIFGKPADYLMACDE